MWSPQREAAHRKGKLSKGHGKQHKNTKKKIAGESAGARVCDKTKIAAPSRPKEAVLAKAYLQGYPNNEPNERFVPYILLKIRPKVNSTVDATRGLGLQAGAVLCLISSLETVVT